MSLDPLRVGIDATRLGIRIATGALKLPFRIAGALLGAHEHERPQEPQQRAQEDEAPQTTPRRQAAPARPAPTVTAAPPMPPTPRPVEPEPEEPIHLDDEPELVGEFAEEGAEDGAGAEIHVAEPWDGYQRMRVADIQARLSTASPAEAAVVQLYEATHRNRRSILDAVERRTRQLANAPNGR